MAVTAAQSLITTANASGMLHFNSNEIYELFNQ